MSPVLSWTSSVVLKVCEETAMIFFLPFSASCIRMAPNTISLALVVRVKSWEKSGNKMTGGKESRSCIFLNALLALSIQVNVLFVLFNSCMGPIRLENVSDLIRSSRRVSRNCLIHTKQPMRLCSAFFVVGGSIFLMARMYSGVSLKPVTANYPPKVFRLSGEEGTFSWIKFESEFVKGGKELLERKYVFAVCLGMDQIVVDIWWYVW